MPAVSQMAQLILPWVPASALFFQPNRGSPHMGDGHGWELQFLSARQGKHVEEYCQKLRADSVPGCQVDFQFYHLLVV